MVWLQVLPLAGSRQLIISLLAIGLTCRADTTFGAVEGKSVALQDVNRRLKRCLQSEYEVKPPTKLSNRICAKKCVAGLEYWAGMDKKGNRRCLPLSDSQSFWQKTSADSQRTLKAAANRTAMQPEASVESAEADSEVHSEAQSGAHYQSQLGQQQVATNNNFPVYPEAAQWQGGLVRPLPSVFHDRLISNRGDRSMLRKFYQKLKTGKDILVLFYGGSCTGGAGVRNVDTDAFRALVVTWLKHQSSGEITCQIDPPDSKAPRNYAKADIIISEISINSDNAMGLEEFLREMVLRRKVPVIGVHWLPFPCLDGWSCREDDLRQGNKEWFHTVNWETDLQETYQYYAVPTISMKTALLPFIFKQKEDGSGRIFWSDDNIHPSEAGHALIAASIIQILWSCRRPGCTCTFCRQHRTY
jgi:hypothetical protein